MPSTSARSAIIVPHGRRFRRRHCQARACGWRSIALRMFLKRLNHVAHVDHVVHSWVFPKVVFVSFVLYVVKAFAVQSSPRDWIDPATGHRIVRLTDDAGGGSTLYFHDNAFSPDGDKLMISTPRGIAVVDVAKIGSPDLAPVIVIES